MLLQFLLLAVVANCLTPAVVDTEHYTTWRIGSADDISTATLNGVGMIGGGPDCVEAFDWQISHANGGDFVVLRASGDDSYNNFIWGRSLITKHPLNSVTTILFKDREAAFDDNVLDLLKNAEAVFFAGGDQNRYMTFWKDSPVQEILQSKLREVTVSGTSAGLAILGSWVFDSKEGSAYSGEALQDPFIKYVSISSGLLSVPHLENVVTDTHFLTRDRMGRMLSFLGRISTDFDVGTRSGLTGVGVDETTALLLNVSSGEAVTVGESRAFVCTVSLDTEIVCQPEQPLQLSNVQCMRLEGLAHDTFSFLTLNGSGISYTSNAANGGIDQPYGPK